MIRYLYSIGFMLIIKVDYEFRLNLYLLFDIFVVDFDIFRTQRKIGTNQALKCKYMVIFTASIHDNTEPTFVSKRQWVSPKFRIFGDGDTCTKSPPMLERQVQCLRLATAAETADTWKWSVSRRRVGTRQWSPVYVGAWWERAWA